MVDSGEHFTQGATVATSSVVAVQQLQSLSKLYQADPSLQDDFKLIYQQKVNLIMTLRHE
jgi:hypothetical protein